MSRRIIQSDAATREIGGQSAFRAQTASIDQNFKTIYPVVPMLEALDGTTNTFPLRTGTDTYSAYPIGGFVKANKGGVTQNIADNTVTLVEWPTEATDTRGEFSSHRWTPTATGRPGRCTANLTYSSGVDTKLYLLMLYVNGSVYEQAAFLASGTGVGEFSIGHTFEFWISAGDYFEIKAFQLSGGAATIAGESGKTNVCFSSY